MQEQDAQLSIDDIAPILGQHQLTIITQDKQIRRLQARIKELEARPEPLDTMADRDIAQRVQELEDGGFIAKAVSSKDGVKT